jgi:hypothetical protein
MRMHTSVMPKSKSGWIILLLLLIGSQVKAITYYSRQSGLWNQNSSWSTVTYGSPVNTGTYPRTGDVVFIGDGHNITMNVNSVTASITVGQGVSGSLLYSGFLTFNMTIAGSLTVNNGAVFGYTGNFTRTHRCFISGNLTNNGTVDLYSDANDVVNLTFNSSINSIVSGTGTWDLNTVTVFKSTSTNFRVEAQSNAFENAIRSLVVSYGTFLHNNSGTYNVNPTAGDLTISPNAVYAVQTGILHLSPNADYVFLQGTLDVRGGECRIGTTAGLQGLRSDQNGTVIPSLLVSGGSLTVYGGITCRLSASSEPFRYSQSGGDVNLQTGSTGTNQDVFFIVNNTSSRFTMSGGSINIQRPSAGGSARTEFSVCGSAGTVSVSGGFVNFGNSSTPSGSVFDFVPYPSAVLPHFRVTGPAAAAVSLRLSNNSTSNFNLLSIRIDPNKTFDIRSVGTTNGDTKVMTLSDNFDNVHAFYNEGTFNARTGTVVFQAVEGLWIGGSVTPNFYNLTINNPLGVSLGRAINVSNNLLMSNGILYSTTAARITLLANGSSNIGSSISYVDGPMAKIVASTAPQTINLPVGKNVSYRPIILAVQHSTTGSVTYVSEVWNASARTFGYALPPTLSWVSDVRHYTITRTSVANLSSARVTLSYGPDDVVNDFANLRVARDNGASAWLDIGGVGTANGSGSITSGNFNAFNTYFTLANTIGGTNPLPVEFASFKATSRKNDVLLDWVTASEKNNDFFEVQRSRNGSDFEVIGREEGAGNSSSLIYYSFTDTDPFSGLSYYRIRQVDYDGRFDYSETRVVERSKTLQWSIYPNPVSDGSITIRFDEFESELDYVLSDLQGRVLQNSRINPDNSKEFRINLGEGIKSGYYLLELRNRDGLRKVQKVQVIL